jgi:hypothetical protein
VISLLLAVVLFLGMLIQKETPVPVSQTALYSISLMVVAGFTVVNTGIAAWREWAQRRRDETLAIERKEVASRASDVAVAAEKVATATQEVKEHLDHTDVITSTALVQIADTTKAVHTIVNSEKTRMMQELKASRLLTLSMAQTLLVDHPESKTAKQAVDLAQSLYDEIAAATQVKQEGDAKTKA